MSVTSDVIDGIKVEGTADSIENVNEDLNALNGDTRQEDTTYCRDSIKVERDSPNNMDNIKETFTCDRNEEDSYEEDSYEEDSYEEDSYEEDSYDYVKDIKKEELTQNVDSITENTTCDNYVEEDPDAYIDDIKEEGITYYNHDGMDQQGHEETKGAGKTGNLFINGISANMGRPDEKAVKLTHIASTGCFKKKGNQTTKG